MIRGNETAEDDHDIVTGVSTLNRDNEIHRENLLLTAMKIMMDLYV